MACSSSRAIKIKPLECLTVPVEEEGVSRNVPALSSYFVTPRSSIPFTAPPKKSTNDQCMMGTKQVWLSKMVVYKSNLEWLLSLPHHRFWSQVVYGTDTWDSVISFLQEGVPFYSLDNLSEDEDIQETYYIIMNLVFKIFVRICTQKESKENWIGKKYGSLLYNYTILSVPIFLDLCAIFGVFNVEEIKKMITNSFEAQPLYKEDFNNSIQHMKAIFHSIEEQFSSNVSNSSIAIPKLTERKLPIKEMVIPHVQDIVLYSLDVAVTLSTFVDFFPEAASILHSHRFEVNIATFYETVMKDLCQSIQSLCDKEGNMDTYFLLMFKLNQARYFLIELHHQCIQSVLNNVIRNEGDLISKEAADGYLDILSETTTFKLFTKDYQNKFPIENDLELLLNKCPDIDNDKRNFLLQSILLSGPPKQKNKTNSVDINPEVLQGPSTSSTSKKVEGVELESLVTEVKDILPHLDDVFVKKCLQFYSYSSSSVINAILENNLPENLSSINQTLPSPGPLVESNTSDSSLMRQESPPPYTPTEKGNPYFPERINIFDNDEFDIMTRDVVDTTRIFKGKRNNPKERDLKDVINDKSFREEFRDKFSMLGLIEEADMYDDEYDDTYDESELPVPEVGEQPFQKFVIPRVLEQMQKKQNTSALGQEESPEEEEDNEEGEMTLQRNSHELFIENPEQIRARREEQRMKKGKSVQKGQPANVTGNPKGQGQEKDVQFNRNKKNVNKSFQANHNRKKAAQYKRFQGM